MKMNKIILMGRLTRDPEIRYSQRENPIPIARYSIAVDKRQKREDGVTADFFNLVAFDRNATFAEKYLRKGIKIVVTGRVQTGRYEKNGVNMPFFEVVVEEQEFAESKSASLTSAGNQNYEDENGFLHVSDDTDDLPFE
jgi:single-strand DNA-binding protein